MTEEQRGLGLVGFRERWGLARGWRRGWWASGSVRVGKRCVSRAALTIATLTRAQVLEYLGNCLELDADRRAHLECVRAYMSTVGVQVRFMSPQRPRDLTLLPRVEMIFAWQERLRRMGDAAVAAVVRRGGRMTLEEALLLRNVVIVMFLVNFLPPMRLAALLSLQVRGAC